MYEAAGLLLAGLEFSLYLWAHRISAFAISILKASRAADPGDGVALVFWNSSSPSRKDILQIWFNLGVMIVFIQVVLFRLADRESVSPAAGHPW